MTAGREYLGRVVDDIKNALDIGPGTKSLPLDNITFTIFRTLDMINNPPGNIILAKYSSHICGRALDIRLGPPQRCRRRRRLYNDL